jgi:phage gp36-like protein
MAYSTRADIEARFGRGAVLGFVDDDASGAAASDEAAFINSAIATADHQIDSMLSNRYGVPFTTPPDLVRDLSCDLAFYEMSKRRGRLDAFIDKIRGDAERVLRELSGGGRSLPGVVPAIYAQSTTSGEDASAIDEW